MGAPGRLRAFYFFYFASVGAGLPYLAPYLAGLGLSGAQIGAVQMIGPLLAAPVGLGWATLADRMGAPGRALRIVCVGAVLGYLALPCATQVWPIAAVMFATGLFVPAIAPLIDSVSVDALAGTGGSYARIRLFGSIGYLLLAQLLGLALTARGDRAGDIVVPLTLLGCVAGYAVTSFGLPASAARGPSDAGIRAHVRAAVGLLADPRLRVLIAVSALHWACCAPYNLLFGVFVREQGLASWITGLGAATGVAAEIAVLYAATAFESRASARTLLLLAFAGTVVRWAMLASASSVFAIVALQLLHGLTFGLFWASVVRALSEYVPARLRATGLALFGAAVFGVGNALGLQLSGVGHDQLGRVAPLFRYAAAIELVPLALLLASRRLVDPRMTGAPLS